MNKDTSQFIPLGWNEHFSEQLNQLDDKYSTTQYHIARVTSVGHGLISLFDGSSHRLAKLTGKLIREREEGKRETLATGDWVIYREEQGSSLIEIVFTPFSELHRGSAGVTSDKQIISVNIDSIFIVSGLDHDFNERRLERYLTISHESGARPVIILNKCDLCGPQEMVSIINQVEELAPGVPVHMVSALYDMGLDELAPYLKPSQTITVVGSSGSGKSSLINRLLGADLQSTAPVRISDSRGRHTTVTRSLFVLPGGGVIIDNPGMREIQLYASEESVEKTFTEISDLIAQCRFNNCTHTSEPGCAVQEALQGGMLNAERWNSYLKQISETGEHKQRHLEQKKAREKEISKLVKDLKKRKYKQ